MFLGSKGICSLLEGNWKNSISDIASVARRKKLAEESDGDLLSFSLVRGVVSTVDTGNMT